MQFLLAIAAGGLAPVTQPTATVEVQILGLRNSRGQVHACVTREPRFFPDCSKDPNALKHTVQAGTAQLRFTGSVPGRYAITLFHDENKNQRLDTVLGIPKEGFGFSRNPVVRFGAPKFDKVDMQLDSGITRASIRMQYLLWGNRPK